MPKYAPIGAIKGTEIIIAEKISIMHPIASRKIFSINKNTNFDEILAECRAGIIKTLAGPERRENGYSYRKSEFKATSADISP